MLEAAAASQAPPGLRRGTLVTAARRGHPAARLARFAAVLLALLLSSSGTAVAAHTHPVEATFSAGGCTVADLAVVESTGTLYAACDSGIRKFDLNGNPVPFGGSAPYISGNAITGDPSDPSGEFDGGFRIDVDNSTANNGYIFVSGGPGTNRGEGIAVFAPSGEWVTTIKQGLGHTIDGVAVGPDGSVYASVENHVSKYSPSLQEVRRLLVGPDGSDYVRADSSGAVWIGTFSANIAVKYEADQFSTNLNTDPFSVEGLGLHPATPSPFVPDSLVEGSAVRFDVDPGNDDLYVHFGNRVVPFSAGDASEPAHQDGPAFGMGAFGSVVPAPGIAVTGDGHVYAANGNSIVKFGPGPVVPDVKTPAPQLEGVGHHSAVVEGVLERAGGPEITSCQVRYGTDSTYASGSVPCSPDPAATSFGEPATTVTAELPGLATGTPYHYRFEAGNANGANFGLDRTVTPAAVLALRTLAAEGVAEHEATLRGSFEPDGLPTTYRFEYGVDTSYGQSTPGVAEPASTGAKTVATAVGDLLAGRTFHYRIVASNSLGTSYGEDRTFRSASPPEVSGVRATEVTASSAVLHARIDSVGYDTSYYFEYGTTPSYGTAIPLSPVDVGSSDQPQEVTQQISNLVPGVTYHFRVVATNAWGTATSDDTTFDFFPPSCPNAHVRQETHTGYLPDCRAYELVSPGKAGSASLYPSEELSLFHKEFSFFSLWPVNTGLATSPSRFAYFVGVGAITGLDAPNAVFDMYMATRTNTGWVTSLPGFKGSEAGFVGQKQCSEILGSCIDHNELEPVFSGEKGESAPTLFDAEGKPLGRLPTNLGIVPGGEKFDGDQRPSPDFSHFVLSSTNVVFAPEGREAPLGSAYDNDIAARTVEVISKLAGGAPIPQELNPSTNPNDQIEFPAISTDGSHILMQVASSDGGTILPDGRVHLYMRVGDAVTYDVSRGRGVKFVGMTADGSEVYFLAKQQLGDGDSDASVDLYRWSEAGDTLARVSQGAGHGNSDACSSSFGNKCDVAALATEGGNPFGIASVPGRDDRLARGSGDAFFYSPELLDPERPGIPNQRNLYLARGGAVQLVASLDPGTTIRRIQISPSGAHAAFLTESRLTGYDNHGFREVYTYDADSGAIRCASCRPDGLPPTGSVAVSQGGPFMSNDGRAFFTTPDSLVPQDSNSHVLDVYEYVNGRPQLISSGTGSRDFTGGGTTVSIFPGVHTGLESVSANGTDVFFSTFDSLVAEDHNGPYVKFYDARTSGGFERQGDLAPCAAADECHGPGSPARTAPIIATGAGLGSTGNARAARHHKGAKGKAAKRRRHRHSGGKRHG